MSDEKHEKIVVDAKEHGYKISFHDAMQILMLSPFYFRQSPAKRLKLIKGYVRRMGRKNG